MQYKYRLISPLLSFVLICSSALPARANDIELPAFGDATSGIISRQQEYELGREWLRAYRSRIPTLNDAELQFYLEQMLFDLSEHSELTDHRLELIVINNPAMNAFAVPGGVIGVHTGLFRFAENEHQLASVLSHELAHLSQRHFARRLDKQRTNSYFALAGLLATLILAATAGGDAASAGMMATQAAALESTLRYSRQNEQEADRIGIDTLVRAGMDPNGAPEMFEAMMRATRYVGSRPPEFLLTHPLTESRISDARGRARSYPAKQYELALDYQLMKARALIAIDNNPAFSVNRFSSELDGDPFSTEAARYGLSIAQLNAGEPAQARETLQPLLLKTPENLHYALLDIRIEREAGNPEQAIRRLNRLLSENPWYLPFRFELALTYQAANRFGEALRVLGRAFEKL
ncbi:MAG: M48 family metalloprotease, partial [bacterium]